MENYSKFMVPLGDVFYADILLPGHFPDGLFSGILFENWASFPKSEHASSSSCDDLVPVVGQIIKFCFPASCAVF